ncbi:GerAB/ArcD/ProY family transporter [Paenibacillus cremeus]|uniref:GerAB/ArcD/ProY family transporter n=1 Tax=Paenibacillus cremeus TaxID=2163881 RepID=A0A559K5Q0_9BACL|nr:endospore germination permease [Paenibacillus cremeus]TVY07478.1 GerAB/ArcD/ProY family transporter [Paenibacillus cremeus]
MKISGNQLFWIMFCFQVHYALNPALLYGKQDAWIICAMGGIAAVFLTLVMVKISLMSKGEAFVVYCQKVLGKGLGKGIVLLYLPVWFMLLVVTLREWADYVFLKLLPNTPVIMVVLPIVLLMIYVNLKGGITAVGRCSQIIGPLYFLISFVPFFMLFGIMDWTNLLPVYQDTGWRHMLRGTVPTMALMMGGTTVPFMITEFDSEPTNITKGAIWAIGLSTLWVFLASVASVLALGSHQAPQLTIPWVDTIRLISILNFIQNVDAFAVCIYTLAHFISISTILFGTSYGFAQSFNLKNWKRTAWVVAGLALFFVILTSDLGHITKLYRETIWIPWIFPIHMIGIPLLLLVAGILKNRRLLRV